MRASLDVSDRVVVRLGFDDGTIDGVLDSVEVLQALRDDVDWKFEDEMRSLKALSHPDRYNSSFPLLLQLDQNVPSNCDFRPLTLAMVSGRQYRWSPPRRCRPGTILSESDQSCAQTKCDQW